VQKHHKYLIKSFCMRVIFIYACLSIVFFQTACRKMVEVDSPVTSLNGDNVFASDATAASVLTGIYARLSQSGFSNAVNINSLSLFAGLSSDEFSLFDLSNTTYLSYYTNSLSASIPLNSAHFWNNVYPIIFSTNAAIQGLNNSTNLTVTVKEQLLGEAKFIRALCYFYLVNLYGDVPLAISTDWSINSKLDRLPKELVYSQIIEDLKEAQVLLTSNYLNANVNASTIERVRPNKWAATSLLARTYLFVGDYLNSESQSTDVINNNSLYDTVSLNKVFLKNSKEAIWQLQPVAISPTTNTQDAYLFILPNTGPSAGQYPVYLSNNVINEFEPADKRKFVWTGNITISGTTYYYPNKYVNATPNASVTEYLMVLRLGEQYLIRAEARAQLNKINEAKADLNIIRRRAGLENTVAIDKISLLTEIERERKVELFTEWGHRWLDLKRWNKADALLGSIKGPNWQSTDVLYPIPLVELQRNQNIIQNLGY
jgi:starch-binding outer membrane protein, SusD/RagB family